jgi:hypothetical protein
MYIYIVVAMSVNCITSFLAIISATVLRMILVHLNKRLDRGETVTGAVTGGVLGDASSRGFRFLV